MLDTILLRPRRAELISEKWALITSVWIIDHLTHGPNQDDKAASCRREKRPYEPKVNHADGAIGRELTNPLLESRKGFLILNSDQNSSGRLFFAERSRLFAIKISLQNSKSMHSLSNFAFQSAVWVENRRNVLCTKREVWKYMQLMLYDAPHFLHTMPRSLWLNKRPISLRLWCKVGS